jgi:uncharacterized protein involved in cysteine biosynthesis
LGAFFKAIGQLGDPAVRRVVWTGLGISLAVFAALWTAVGYVLANTALFASGWLEALADVAGGLTALVFTWLLFPGVVSAVTTVLLDAVARAVEARHYPHLPEAPGAGTAATVLTAAKFLGALVVLNTAALLFLLVPPVFPFVFYAVNGYLLGREYFELVALRRAGNAETRALRKAHRGQLFLAGLVIALLLTVPVVNLLAPVTATAVMVHLFELWRTRGQAA